MLLYPSFPERGSKEETMIQQPTLHLSAAKELSRLPNVEIFKVSKRYVRDCPQMKRQLCLVGSIALALCYENLSVLCNVE